MTLTLGPGPEFDRIRAIAARLGPLAVGLGDDAAVIPLGGTNLVASIDCCVEGVHFRTDWLTFQEIGWRCAAAALSDLAAEGAGVVGVLVSIGSPNGTRREPGAVGSDPVSDIMEGVGRAVSSVGGKVLGGDLVRSDTYLVDVCVLGEAGRPVTRAGAKPGDGIWATGAFGGPGAALASLMKGAKPSDRHRARFAHPEPRIAGGRWLAEHGAHAMIDVSDGLAADLEHLAAASGVSITIAADQVPRVEGVEAVAALASGEEYELAVALPKDFADAGGFARVAGVPLTRIGVVAAGAGVHVTLGGRPVPVPAGFDHFR